MFEYDTIKHHIPRSIIEYLQTHEYARFTDMRPKGIDTNLFTYHLKQLITDGYIEKTDTGYTLAQKGLVYVDRVSSVKMKLRSQPKIITMLLVQDSYGKVLIQQRLKQPYINTWTLPYGKVHIDDTSVLAAAIRESKEKLHHTPSNLRHVGDCYIVVHHKKQAKNTDATSTIQSRTLAHVTRFEADDIEMNSQLCWVRLEDLGDMRLAPAVVQIVRTAFLNDGFFFEEFQV